jgi:hypothetical protein
MLRCAILAGFLVLVGCARSLTESQCVAGDWETVGYRDGSRGLPAAQQLLEHQNACVRHGVVPDRSNYLFGWEQGIFRFCTPENGFARGERGADYPRVCPVEQEAGFQSAYRDGRSLYLARSELRRLQQLFDSRSADLERADEALTEIAIRIATDDEATAAERVGWVNESIKLTRSRVHLESEIAALAEDIAVQRVLLDELHDDVAYRY